MENNNNNNNFAFVKKSNNESKTKLWKPPTRLQKRAPATLQLDQIDNEKRASSSFTPSPGSSRAIPLLSPLILSPKPLPEVPENRRSGNSGREKKDDGAKDESATPPLPPSSGTGWQHPAGASLPEPPSLFTSFQTQCVIMNHAQ